MVQPAEPGTMVFHPGEFIADELETRKLNPKVLVISGWNLSQVRLLLQGVSRIDFKMANHIRTLWGFDTEFWFRLQIQWDTYKDLREAPPWPRKFRKEELDASS